MISPSLVNVVMIILVTSVALFLFALGVVVGIVGSQNTFDTGYYEGVDDGIDYVNCITSEYDDASLYLVLDFDVVSNNCAVDHFLEEYYEVEE